MLVTYINNIEEIIKTIKNTLIKNHLQANFEILLRTNVQKYLLEIQPFLKVQVNTDI